MCGRPSPLNFQVSFRWRLRPLASVQTNHPDVLMVPSSALILAVCQQSGAPKDHGLTNYPYQPGNYNNLCYLLLACFSHGPACMCSQKLALTVAMPVQVAKD